MNASEIEQMEKFEKTYWWHVGKRNLVQSLMRKYFSDGDQKILEVGCGSGEITRLLKDYGEVYANDISEKALEFCKSKNIEKFIHGDISDLDLSEHNESFDVILALDVLEHLQDDVEVINKLNQVLKPGGVLLVNVPAYKFLWSAHDEALQHRRRYNTHEITTKLSESGFEVLKSSYFVFFVFPVVATFKFLSNFIGKNAYPKVSYITLPDTLNRLMIRILDLEIKILHYLSLPFGTTINVIARKDLN